MFDCYLCSALKRYVSGSREKMTKDTKMLQPSSDSEASSPTLVNIPLDLQIIICTLVDPSDILALRQTCKTLQLPTRQRVVWVAAIHQICFDNSLFLPSFPIVDMSDVELERAAMGPRRWIELCVGFAKQHPNDSGNNSGATLLPRTTRAIEDPYAASTHPTLFIVPGGRYMVSNSVFQGIFVWDLGYTSSAECKLIAEVGPEGGSYYCMVQATPDGTGLVILSFNPYECCSVYEIYPQSESPQLTHIAHLDFDPTKFLHLYLLPDRAVWYGFYEDKIIFRVWDYRANHSISFSADLDNKKFGYKIQVIATKTVIIVLCEEEVLFWAVPPLLPQPPDFFDHNPTHIPSLFAIPFPDGIVNHAELVKWQTMSHWYSGSSQPLYFDILCRDSKLHRFEIIVKPNLIDTSLHLINTEIVPHDFAKVTFYPYSICEDSLVACWDSSRRFGAYTGLTSSRFTTLTSHGGPAANMLLPPTSGYNLFLCPTSGRYVYLDKDISGIVAVDLF